MHLLPRLHRLAHHREAHQRPALHAVIGVLAALASAQLRARDLRLIALAVVLQATRLLAVAALRVLAFPIASANLRVEGHRIAIKRHFDDTRPLLLILQVVHAIGAVAVLTQLALREAIAVELEAVRLRAVARLARLGRGAGGMGHHRGGRSGY